MSMPQNQYLGIYLRTSISEGGLHYKPGPVIQARQNSDLILNMQIIDLSKGKSPHSLHMKHVRFIVRKDKYPRSEEDILIVLDSNSGIVHESVSNGLVKVHIPHEELDLPVTDYWYDILLYDLGEFDFGNLNATEDEELIRPPLGRFKVMK